LYIQQKKKKKGFLIPLIKRWGGGQGSAELTLAGAVDCDCGQCWWVGLSLSQVHGLGPEFS